MIKSTWLPELIEDMKLLSQNHKLSIDITKFQPVKVTIDTKTLNQQQLLDTIEQLGNVEGWVQATSQVKTLNNEQINTNSPLLNGEWVSGVADEQSSYLLEYLGDYQWSLQRCILKNTDSEQATHLAERVVHREVGPKNTRSLIYQKLWSASENAPEPDMAVFVGFDV